ncbi:MAG TPA: PA2169 family four-helix-bundle protein, partial [Allosphingosinicella sp.]|nr:PA2169 family four-helix-bundle protein [Allosphingosinicella sp.]
SALGFERAAEDADSGRFASLFRDFAAERREVVAGLQAAVRALGGTPEDDGSLKADLHRRWLDLRAALSGDGGDKAVIAEVERGEDYLKAKYEAALADTRLSAGMNAIQAAYESVRAGHDTASALKHRMEDATA